VPASVTGGPGRPGPHRWPGAPSASRCDTVGVVPRPTSGSTPPPSARLAASGSLVILAATAVLVVVFTLRNIGFVLATVAGVSLAVPAIWIALTNRRWRWLALGAALVLVGGAVASMVAAGDDVLVIVSAFAGTALAGGLGTLALRHEVLRATADRWRSVPAAAHPVLLMNPRSGGGKVERFRLAAEAARRGIEGLVLESDDDLRHLAEAAVAGGADVLGMAGGDGSQAIVASVAADHGLAFVCVPAGTRNHLALDLGVARNDPVGALDAFGPAREASVDLASVNGRVFVNNVSLGLYAEIVAADDYREAKVRTTAEVLETVLGPDAPAFDLRVDGPGGGVDGPQLVQISNNPYLLTSLSGFGTRPRLDAGTLGIVTLRVGGPVDVQRLVALELAGTGGNGTRVGGRGRPPRRRSWHRRRLRPGSTGSRARSRLPSGSSPCPGHSGSGWPTATPGRRRP
jgi:diacylglycerol kinase family enzyme